MIDKVNLHDKFTRFNDHWKPRIVGELNGQQVKLAKIVGEFIWHKHDNEDELFLVVKGRFRMEFGDCQIWVEEGEVLIRLKYRRFRGWDSAVATIAIRSRRNSPKTMLGVKLGRAIRIKDEGTDVENWSYSNGSADNESGPLGCGQFKQEERRGSFSENAKSEARANS